MSNRVNVCLLIIATNKYTSYLKNLLDSADKYFLKNHNVTYNIFTDKVEEVKMLNHKNVSVHLIEHRPFPYPTLHRFHFFKQYEKEISGYDQYVYIDADCLITSEIGDEIIGERVPVQHCGFINERGTFETNPNSTSYIPENEGKEYFGGGFWSFSKIEFWKFINKAVNMINIDQWNNIIPIWHDESVLNKYLSVNLPTKILSPSYHYPENHPNIHTAWKNKKLSFDCKVLLLDKNHEEIRK